MPACSRFDTDSDLTDARRFADLPLCFRRGGSDPFVSCGEPCRVDRDRLLLSTDAGIEVPVVEHTGVAVLGLQHESSLQEMC